MFGKRGAEAFTLPLDGHRVRLIGHELLDLVAEPVPVTGLVQMHGDLHVLLTDPEAFERVP